ncbi:hypothetical protein BC567DRAFT_286545, partial [Phyllosticta citribraziliensis]
LSPGLTRSLTRILFVRSQNRTFLRLLYLSKAKEKEEEAKDMANSSRPRVVAFTYAAILFVCLQGSSSPGALAAPVRPTLPLPLPLLLPSSPPSTLPSTRPLPLSREQRWEQMWEQPEERLSATLPTASRLPVPHKDNHSPLDMTSTSGTGSRPTLPAPEVHLPEVHLSAPAVPTLPTASTPPKLANHTDDAFQLGNVHVQAQVKTPTNATEEEKKAALAQALREAIVVFERQGQNQTATTATTSTDDRMAKAADDDDDDDDDAAAKEVLRKRDLQKDDQPKPFLDKKTKELLGKLLKNVPRVHRHGGAVTNTINSNASTTTTTTATTALSDKERKRQEKERKRQEKADAKQRKAEEALLEWWRNFNQIKDKKKSLSKRAADAPDFARKVAMLQDALGKVSADANAANRNANANSTGIMADSTLSNLTSSLNNPNPTVTNLPDSTPLTTPTAADTAERTNATAAAATDAKTAILQLAAAANKVRNGKRKDEVMKAVKAVKAVAAATSGDLELAFWKKVIGILDDIFGDIYG